MKVTIIYDQMEGHSIRIVKYGEDVMYFGVNTFGKTNHYIRGFYSLEDVYKWATDNEEYCKNSKPKDFENKESFYTEADFCKWISLLCDDMDDLEEIYINF